MNSVSIHPSKQSSLSVSSRHSISDINFTSDCGDGAGFVPPRLHLLITDRGTVGARVTVADQLQSGICYVVWEKRHGRRAGEVAVVYSVFVLRKWTGLGWAGAVLCVCVCMIREGIQNGVETMRRRQDGKDNAASTVKREA